MEETFYEVLDMSQLLLYFVINSYFHKYLTDFHV